jgi:asparagine synthase (glutamine-hydrolysing)
MCGIAGIIGANWTRAQLEAMVASQQHRGPDGCGIYIDPTGIAGLGHNRLRIIDLTDAGRQPMSDSAGRYWIVFNGEIYNYLELRSELSDYPYRSRTDTEVILAAYIRWGAKCLDRFIGMFALAIWDSYAGTLFCARDRLGIKPFYYVVAGETIMFASEIKALLAAGWPARVNDALVFDYLASGLYEHTEQTFFQGVLALEPGHSLIWDTNRAVIRPYWDLAAIIADCSTALEAPANWREDLKDLLIDAVRLRLRSDVPVGLHLTGGLDSSSILALLDSLMPEGGQIEAFTGVYGDRRYDEEAYSAEVTRSLNVTSNVCQLDCESFWETAAATQWHQEQPFGGVATVVYWNMEAYARQKGIIVLLEGQGGDELFGGYTYYIAEHAQDLVNAGRHDELRRFVEHYAAVHQMPVESMWKRIEAMQASARQSYQDGSTYLRPECLSPVFASAIKREHAFPAPTRSAFVNARFRDIRYTKLPRVLRFNDRMSMAFGCELRVPLLDHRVVEYSFRLPNSLMMHQGLPKWPLRAAMDGCLPDSIRLAPKRAVVTPQREWFRGPMRAAIEDRLRNSEAVKRGYLEASCVERAFSNFGTDESQTNSFFIWQWLNLDLWFEIFRPS